MGNKLGEITTNDRAVSDALFLHKHSAFRPEDLGYPPRDKVIIDLMRQFE